VGWGSAGVKILGMRCGGEVSDIGCMYMLRYLERFYVFMILGRVGFLLMIGLLLSISSRNGVFLLCIFEDFCS